jgi:hypothetical protein
MDQTQFIVAAVSENTNSFGLHSVIMIAKCGTAFQVLQNSLNVLAEGDIKNINTDNDFEGNPISYDFVRSLTGVECPTRLKNAPRDIVVEAWSE